MSVSVLSIFETSPPFSSGGAMSSQPPNLKRPWETQSSHLASHRASSMKRGAVPEPSVASEPSGGYIYPDSRYQYPPYRQEGPAPPRELQQKRSRLESESVASTPGSGIFHSGRVSPAQAAHALARAPSFSQTSTTSGEASSPSVSSPPGSFFGGHGYGQAPVLPSPKSMSNSTGAAPPPPQQQQHYAQLPSMNSALLSPVSPSSTQLQGLQQELSAKHHAYQNLQATHEKMVADYQRLQTRLSVLDRKSKEADSELTMLQEERISLQDRVEQLESELEDMRQQKEQAADERSRESAQWRRIIDLSGDLQRRHTEESERWRSEKAALTKRVDSLEGQLQRVRLSSNGTGSAADAEAVDEGAGDAEAKASRELNDDSTSLLKSEVVFLRQQCEQGRRRLEEYETRMDELRQLLSKAASVTGLLATG